MKKRYLWGFTGLLLCGIVGLAEAHDGYRKHSPNRLLIPPQTYVDNCGSCHTAYSALLLPSGSWKRLMGDLPNHFDAAVELDAADKEQIGAWLQGNAADTGTTRRGAGIHAAFEMLPFFIWRGAEYHFDNINLTKVTP